MGSEKEQLEMIEKDVVELVRNQANKLLVPFTEKLSRIFSDSRKILSLFGHEKKNNKPSDPVATNAWTGLDVLQTELELIHAGVLELQDVNKVLSNKLVYSEPIINGGDWVEWVRCDNNKESAKCGEGTTKGTAPETENNKEEGKEIWRVVTIEPGPIDTAREMEEEFEMSLTMEEENERLRDQLSALQDLVPLKGESVKGQGKETLTELSVGISTDPSVVIRIANYLDVPLEQPSIYHWDNGSAAQGELPKVQPKTSEVVRVTCLASKVKISGQVGYKIPNSDRRLFINFEVSKGGQSFIALSLGPDHVAVGDAAIEYIWNQGNSSAFRPDTRRTLGDGTGGQLLVFNGQLRAWGEISTSSKAIVRVAVWSEEAARDLVRRWKSSSGEISRFIGPVRKPFACRVILENSSKFDLLEDELFISRGVALGDISSVLRPTESATLLVSGSKSTEGVIAYKIGKTDIKLVTAFWLTPSRNYFTICFIKEDREIDSALLSSMSSDPDDWTRAHFKCASPSDGEQVIEMRNVLVKASMSSSICSSAKARHALLKISVHLRKSTYAQ